MALIKCTDCKKKISDSVEICPNCGKKLTQEDKIIGFSKIQSGRKKKRYILIISSIIFLVLIIFSFLFVNYIQNKEGEKKNKLEKIKIEKMKDIKNRAKEYTKNIEIIYKEEKEIYNKMVSIWYNSVYEIDDKETDEYTKEKGKFVGMDKAIEKFGNSNFLKKKADVIFEKMEKANLQTEETKKIYKDVVDVKEIYELLKKASESANKYMDKVNNPTGMNYESYMNQCTELETELSGIIGELKSLET